MLENLAYELPEEDEIIADEGWHIEDAGDAEWALARIRELRMTRDRKKAAARAMIDRYELDMRKADETCAREEEFFVGKLREWFETEPKRELKASYAVDLPSGKLTIDKAPKLDYIRDADKLTAFVRKNAPEFTKITYGVDWAELKKHILVTGDAVTINTSGEVVDGVTVARIPPEFKIKL